MKIYCILGERSEEKKKNKHKKNDIGGNAVCCFHSTYVFQLQRAAYDKLYQNGLVRTACIAGILYIRTNGRGYSVPC